MKLFQLARYGRGLTVDLTRVPPDIVDKFADWHAEATEIEESQRARTP